MDDAELVQRLARTLRADIGPAVGDDYTRTQAFMASVILERVGRQLELAPAHRAAETADLAQLHERLTRWVDDPATPEAVRAAIIAARQAARIAELGPVITELYRWGPRHQPDAAEALDLIRGVLRSDIDRRMEVAR